MRDEGSDLASPSKKTTNHSPEVKASPRVNNNLKAIDLIFAFDYEITKFNQM